jgi:hypothetical protein
VKIINKLKKAMKSNNQAFTNIPDLILSIHESNQGRIMTYVNGVGYESESGV